MLDPPFSGSSVARHSLRDWRPVPVVVKSVFIKLSMVIQQNIQSLMPRANLRNIRSLEKISGTRFLLETFIFFLWFLYFSMLELVSIRLLHKPTMLLSDYACCQLTFVVKPFFHCAFVYLKQIVKICCLSLYEVATRFSTQSLPQITCEQIWSTIIKQVYFCFGSCHFCIDINRIS